METMTAQEFWDMLLKNRSLEQIKITFEADHYGKDFSKYIVTDTKSGKNLLWVYKDNSIYAYTDFLGSYLEHYLNPDETKKLYWKIDRMYDKQFEPDYLYNDLCSAETGQEMLLRIARCKNLEEKNNCGDTVLCIAAQKGNLEVVNALIKAGANLNHQNNNDCSPVILAAYNRHNEVVKALADAGSNLDLVDKYNRTVLMVAAKHQNLNLLQTLIDVIKAKKENEKKQKPSITITLRPLSLNEKNAVSVNGVVQSNNKINETVKTANNGEKALQDIMTEKKNNLTHTWADSWSDAYGF